MSGLRGGYKNVLKCRLEVFNNGCIQLLVSLFLDDKIKRVNNN